VARDMQMLGGKPQGERAPRESAPASEPAPVGEFDDDIPF